MLFFPLYFFFFWLFQRHNTGSSLSMFSMSIGLQSKTLSRHSHEGKLERLKFYQETNLTFFSSQIFFLKLKTHTGERPCKFELHKIFQSLISANLFQFNARSVWRSFHRSETSKLYLKQTFNCFFVHFLTEIFTEYPQNNSLRLVYCLTIYN